MNAIRIFIAIESPDEIKDEIVNLQKRLKTSQADVRWEARQKLHITIKFLGDVNEQLLPALLSTIEKAVKPYNSFALNYHALGCFPNNQHPRIIWVGAENPDGTLSLLKRSLDTHLQTIGFSSEKQKTFEPHITIGRIKSERGVANLISMMETLTFAPRTFHVNHIVVMKSRLKPSGSEYSILETVQLTY